VGAVVATEVVVGPALLESAWAITRTERAAATTLSPPARSTPVMGMHIGVHAAAADRRGPRSPRCGCWRPLPCVTGAMTPVAAVGTGLVPTPRGVPSGAVSDRAIASAAAWLTAVTARNVELLEGVPRARRHAAKR
jgi:hypothetical protein